MTDKTVSACHKCKLENNLGVCDVIGCSNHTPTHSPTETVSDKKIRKSIKFMASEGCSPESIVFAHGQIVTPDERDYLLEYEKKTKVEPTVEKWEEELNKIPLIEIKMMNDVWNSLKPVPSPNLVSFIRTLIAQSVQEAKAEMVQKIKGHKCPRHQLFCACQMEILASLKQEEEKV